MCYAENSKTYFLLLGTTTKAAEFELDCELRRQRQSSAEMGITVEWDSNSDSVRLGHTEGEQIHRHQGTGGQRMRLQQGKLGGGRQGLARGTGHGEIKGWERPASHQS